MRELPPRPNPADFVPTEGDRWEALRAGVTPKDAMMQRKISATAATWAPAKREQFLASLRENHRKRTLMLSQLRRSRLRTMIVSRVWVRPRATRTTTSRRNRRSSRGSPGRSTDPEPAPDPHLVALLEREGGVGLLLDRAAALDDPDRQRVLDAIPFGMLADLIEGWR